jgi:pyruvate, orthophosphate dikinase
MTSGTRRMTAPLLLDGRRELDRNLVGGKAWSVNRLRSLGLPVPPAFTLTTDVCREVLVAGALPASVVAALDDGIAALQAELGRGFGATSRPLLVSVRSGAARSMPGMMDTVLNVGTTTSTLAALSAEFSPAFAADVHTRFAAQFEKVVGAVAPDDARGQLQAAAEAVFRSWNSPRAIAYRKHHRLADGGGTAVTVQAMVFGNRGATSGTGVLFTRNPHTGGAAPFGEWLPNAQGEDVVSGRVDPRPLQALADELPAVHAELMAAAQLLERELRDVQDIEFTIDDGRLWLLQTRAAKRSPIAVARLAVVLETGGVIDRAEALARLTPATVAALREPTVDPVAAAEARVLASGEPASPGVATGVVVLSSEDAEDRADNGESVVLARPTTDPDDIHGMAAAVAVVTELGGATSHAAVVSRELGRVCVVGCGVGTLTALAGQVVTVDGTSGLIYVGAVPTVAPTAQDADLDVIAGWLAAAPDPALEAALARTSAATT